VFYVDGRNQFVSVNVLSVAAFSLLYKSVSLFIVKKTPTADIRRAHNGWLHHKMSYPTLLSTDGKY
jgi:hypothetical protein